MKVPTAESFYDKKDNNGNPMSFNEKMIEFAKLHVTEALKEVEESIYINATCNICCNGSEIAFNENPIKNVYPLYRIN